MNDEQNPKITPEPTAPAEPTAPDQNRRQALADLAKLGAIAGPLMVTLLTPDPARAISTGSPKTYGGYES